ncbi:mechanosensitive ion channel family protein [Sulfurimonas sp. SAG-AH-194-L11]|nr:mechanosensitive ion channel family protein [Sulfurimonas sp. SAG-AH-194-L11]MDF1877264.1 mechanosensitive ion channel family protein [Sulfurimonas sp. SAG-AH-194-L11]
MKKRVFVVLFILLSSLLSRASIHYPEFVVNQMSIVEKMDESNTTSESIGELLQEQNRLYEESMNFIMSNKKKFIENVEQYEDEIFSLNKVMTINRRAGNTFAVLRDEVALKIYLILRSQNRMVKSILIALDSDTLQAYETKLNDIVNSNQEEVQKYFTKDYAQVLALNEESKILAIAKKNIHELRLLETVNADLIAYIYKFSPKMYRLNKYSKYHLISVAIYINSLSLVEVLNPILASYGLSVIKLISMLLLILLIYFFRKVVYVSIERYIFKIDLLNKYSVEISQKIKSSLEALIIVININMLIYVYLDFSSVEVITRFFNIVYGFFFTLILYKVVNTIAKVKLYSENINKSNIKNDLVNVGIKIVNFIIIMIGVLIMLFFAGVNLTAVLSGLGIGGFAVAFAAKDTISNFFGTLSILFSDVFSQGDWIEIDGHQGVVVEIGLRVTTIRTFDNALIAIPNGTFASNDVKNWDKRILGRRIKMHIGVKYDSKSEDIKSAIQAIRVMLDAHPGIATKATKYSHHNEKSHTAKLVSKDDLEGVKNNLLVYLDNFGDSSINILIYCFSKSVRWVDWLETKEDVMHKIMAILEANNLEFAFPSLSIYNETQES